MLGDTLVWCMQPEATHCFDAAAPIVLLSVLGRRHHRHTGRRTQAADGVVGGCCNCKRFIPRGSKTGNVEVVRALLALPPEARVNLATDETMAQPLCPPCGLPEWVGPYADVAQTILALPLERRVDPTVCHNCILCRACNRGQVALLLDLPGERGIVVGTGDTAACLWLASSSTCKWFAPFWL